MINWILDKIFPPRQWIEANPHDISILPGGYILHHSICWCKENKCSLK